MDLLLDEGSGRSTEGGPERAGRYGGQTITAASLNGFITIFAGHDTYHIDITPEKCRYEKNNGSIGYRSPVPRASAVSIKVASSVG